MRIDEMMKLYPLHQYSNRASEIQNSRTDNTYYLRQYVDNRNVSYYDIIKCDVDDVFGRQGCAL